MEPRLLHGVTDPVATVVVRHPAKRNAMTAAMWRALPPLLDEAHGGLPREARVTGWLRVVASGEQPDHPGVVVVRDAAERGEAPAGAGGEAADGEAVAAGSPVDAGGRP
ncbi:hypothetical protein SUDANB6_00618 [Streptomyces sp. enrichment culture]